MMRTSTLIVSMPPSRMNSRSCITRSSLACVSRGMFPISSKKMLPLSARSHSPFFGYTAPVNAPFTCPKSVDSSRSGGRLPELTVTKARSERDEFVWIARATSSLPVPLSPVMRIVERLGAAWMIRSKTCFIRGLRPMMPANFCDCACRFCRSAVFSAISRRRSTALRTTTSTSSFLNGLVM